VIKGFAGGGGILDGDLVNATEGILDPDTRGWDWSTLVLG